MLQNDTTPDSTTPSAAPADKFGGRTVEVLSAECVSARIDAILQEKSDVWIGSAAYKIFTDNGGLNRLKQMRLPNSASALWRPDLPEFGVAYKAVAHG